MKKIRLDVEALQVESFDATARGVRGHVDTLQCPAQPPNSMGSANTCQNSCGSWECACSAQCSGPMCTRFGCIASYDYC